MSDLFEMTIKHILEEEGGYVKHPNDRGGPTKYGVTLKFYRGSVDPDATEQDIKGLSIEEAKKIYKDHFWIDTGYHDLPYMIAKRMLSFGINMGPRQANKLLQRAINAACGGQELVDDGFLGPKTKEALWKCEPEMVRVALRSEAAGYYRGIVEGNKSQAVFLKGWLTRAYS